MACAQRLDDQAELGAAKAGARRLRLPAEPTAGEQVLGEGEPELILVLAAERQIPKRRERIGRAGALERRLERIEPLADRRTGQRDEPRANGRGHRARRIAAATVALGRDQALESDNASSKQVGAQRDDEFDVLRS